MRKNAIVLVVILVVAGLALFLLGRDLWGPGGDDEYERDRPSNGSDPLADGPSGSGTAMGEKDEVRDAVLFGRARKRHEGTGAVIGRVAVAETGDPVAGASLVLAGQAFAGAPVSMRTRTSDDGSFRLADVPGGDVYALRITASDLPGRTLPDIRVLPGSVARLGTIWLGGTASFEGRIVDGTNRPVFDADVRVHVGSVSLLDLVSNFSELFATLDREPEPVAQTRSSSDGTFVFDALDPGPVVMAVRATGHASVQRRVVVPPAGSQNHPLVIRLAEGTAIIGRVVDHAGRGIGGARVAVVGQSDPLSFLYGRVFSDTESDGRFRIDTAGVAANTMLIAAASGYPTTSRLVKSDETDVTIALRRGAELTIRFLVEPDDVPLEGAEIFLVVGDESDMTATKNQSFGAGTTDRFGEVRSNTRPGQLQMVWVQHPDRATGMWMGGAAGGMIPGAMAGPEDPTISEGRQELVFRLKPTLTVRGRVTGPNGEAVAGARISSLGGFMFGRSTITDADGVYTFHSTAGLEGTGFLAIVVTAEGYVQDDASMAVDTSEIEDGIIEHDLELAAAGVVSGRVLDAAGTPVVGAEVRAVGGGGMQMGLAMFNTVDGISGPGGRYVLDGVPPGDETRILARHPAYVDGATEPFAVEGGGSVSGQDIVLRKGHTLEIEVTDPRGGAVAGAKVELSYGKADDVQWDIMDALSNDAARRTDASGRVREDRVPWGVVTITVSHPDHAGAIETVQVSKLVPDPLEVAVQLQPGVTLSGRVVDTAGTPLAGASVSVTPAGEFDGPAQVGTTKDDGTFRFDRVPPGEITLYARAAGHRPDSVTVRAPATEAEIRLAPLDPDVEKRRADIMQRLGEVGMRYQSAKNDAEREALTAEIQALQRELGELPAEDR